MGGPAIHVASLAAGLETRGYHTTLVAGTLARGEDSMAFVAERLGVEIVDVPEMAREVAPLLDARSARRPPTTTRYPRPPTLPTPTPLARGSDVLVAVSPEVRDELVELGVAPREKFAVVRLGIPLAERLGDPTADLDYRGLYGIPRDAFVVGWVGRMTGVKDSGAVLEIVRATRDLGVDAVLCMVGDGPDREGLEQQAHELGIARQTYFVGYQPDVAGYYRLFDTFVLPSVNEGTPVSAIEALASGTPVVATRVGGVPDVVRDGLDGYLVEPGDVEGAARRVAELARDGALRERLGASGRERGLRRYSVERLVEDVDRLYRSLLEAKAVS